MTNTVIISNSFKREVKPLAKKYLTLRTSVDTLIEKLIKDPYLGESYGKNIYKVSYLMKVKELVKVVVLG